MTPLATSELSVRATVMTPLAAGGTAFHRDAILHVGPDGCIRAVVPAGVGRRAESACSPVLDLRPALIVPGFVDAHLHFPQARIIGRATGPLLSWLTESVFPEEARFRRRDYACSVAAELLTRMLAAGTTTAALYSSSSARATEVLFEALRDSGMRAVVGLTLMDRACPKELAVGVERAMRESRRLIRQFHGHDRDRLRFAVTPRFAPTSSRALLTAAGRLAADHQLLVQTHVAETKAEARLAARAHPYASSYLDIYDRAGLLGCRTVLAHAIHFSRRDYDLIAKREAAVVHCPDSNAFLGSGRMKLEPLRSREIDVGLGSDVAAGRSFSMRRAMAHAYDNALALEAPVHPEALLRMATLGGAKALGCADLTGSLEPGKDADFVVIPVSRVPLTLDDALATLVFDNDDPNVARSYVRGRRLR